MPNLIELQYNPYIPSMSVLIDGKQPPTFSRLVQYSDEDICYWYREILDAIYSEIRNDFVVSFTGTEQDAAVLEYMCKQHRFCRGFKAERFLVSEPLQIRLQKLNKYIKQSNISEYAKTVIDISFLLTPQTQKYLEEISSIDVNNLFCAVRISIIGAKSKFEEVENGFMFILAESGESIDDYLERQQTQKPIFVITVGSGVGLKKVTDKAWVFETTPESVFDTIFSCLLQMPLLQAFRRCMKSLQVSRNDTMLYKIACIEPLINIDVGNRVESGKSIKITVTLDPPLGQPPKLVYKIPNQSIASCDGLCVFGKQAGIASLEVYRSGETKPFFVKDITIFQRNRISRIILSDDTLLLGVGDRKRLRCTYAPENADNAHEIRWKSSDEGIARVDNNGGLTAISVGTCRIICTAENVSAQCMCAVKPYLKDISLGIDLQDGVLYLDPFAEVSLQIVKTPNDCIDGELTIISSDYNAVNVVKNTLYAKDKGEAEITIKNSTGRINRRFKVEIVKKKVGFFRSLFGKK